MTNFVLWRMHAPWLAVVLMVGCNCARAGESGLAAEGDARAELRKRAAQFSEAVLRASASAWSKPDVEALVDFYTHDAVLFPPAADPIRHRDAIRAYWTRTPDRRILEHEIHTERIDVSGDLAADHGTFAICFISAGLEPERATLRFISSWRRGTDGQWRKQLDTWW